MSTSSVTIIRIEKLKKSLYFFTYPRNLDEPIVRFLSHGQFVAL